MSILIPLLFIVGAIGYAYLAYEAVTIVNKHVDLFSAVVTAAAFGYMIITLVGAAILILRLN